MTKGKHIKRFCFKVTNTLRTEKQISFDLKDIDFKNSMLAFGIERFDVFKRDSFCFVILDVKPQVDILSLKNQLKERTVWRSICLDKAILPDRIYKKTLKKTFSQKKLMITKER